MYSLIITIHYFTYRKTHIWSHAYECTYMSTHIWVHIYEDTYMIVVKYSYMCNLILIYVYHIWAKILIYELSYVWHSYMCNDILVHIYDCTYMTAHIWLLTYEYTHMTTHIWLLIYECKHMTTHIWVSKSSYVCQVYDDSYMSSAQRSYVCMHMIICCGIWFADIWSYVRIWYSYMSIQTYDTHIWVHFPLRWIPMS